MKLAPVLLVLGVAVLGLAACGGTHNTKKPGVTASSPVTRPLGRPIVVKLTGRVTGTAQLRRLGNTQTSVSLKLAAGTSTKGLTAELDRGSCGAPKGLQATKPLGAVRSRQAGWSVLAPLTKLTAAPLAFVLRGKGRVVGCGNVRQA